MKSAQLTRFKHPLRIADIDLPPLGDCEVAVRIRFAGINFYELMLMDGTYPTLPQLPATPGGELAGVILAVGKKVTSFTKGDRVFSLAQTGRGTTGSYAQVTHINQQYLYHLPKEVSFKAGAAIPMAGFAAYTMITKRMHIPKGGTILIHSAAGGVGSALVQFAHALFPAATIIATCSGKKKGEMVRALGADLVIDTAKASFADRIRTKFSDGIDAIFDPIGQGALNAHLSLLRPLTGAICTYGTYTGAITDPVLVSKLRNGNVTISGFLMWPLLEDKKFCEEIFAKVFRLMKTKRFKPLIDTVFPLGEVNEAVARIRQRKNVGKVLLTSLLRP